MHRVKGHCSGLAQGAAAAAAVKGGGDTYVKSFAGYCVFTYVLGIGDRPLKNLILIPDGHFFHLDFCSILGNDPKLRRRWWPPLAVINK